MAEALSNSSFLPSRPCSSSNSQRLSLKLPSTLRPFSSSDYYGRRIEIGEANGISRISVSPPRSSTFSHNGFLTPKAQKWWEKRLQPNMKEVTDAQALVDSLLNAGDKLVIVIFFSPGCGACKALHPKICQFAEMNPNVQFLQVNYEEHKSMCYSLGVHVLPFFHFYRGAHGHLCSFSCTNATIKKFKDALAKHNTDRCSIGPTQGLEEKDLVALAANIELSFNYTPKLAKEVLDPIPAHVGGVEISEPERSRPEQLPLPLPSNILKSVQTSKENTYVG